MSRKQFSVPTSSHAGKKTRKEQKAEMKASQEEFARQQQEQQGFSSQNPIADAPLIDTPEDQEQMKKLLIWASVVSVALLAIMYYFFV